MLKIHVYMQNEVRLPTNKATVIMEKNSNFFFHILCMPDIVNFVLEKPKCLYVDLPSNLPNSFLSKFYISCIQSK